MQTYWLAAGHANNNRLSVSSHNLTESREPSLRMNPVLLKSKRNLGMGTKPSSGGNRGSQLAQLRSSRSFKVTTPNSQKGDEGPMEQKNSLSPADDSNQIKPNSVRFSTKGRPPLEGRGSMHTSASKRTLVVTSKKTSRLVRWNAEVLSRLLKQIIARRTAIKDLDRSGKEAKTPVSDATTSVGVVSKGNESGVTEETKPDDSSQVESSDDNSDSNFGLIGKNTVLEEVREIIHLPTFDAEAARNQEDPYNVQLDEAVKDQVSVSSRKKVPGLFQPLNYLPCNAQLLAYVTEVASMYR